MWTGRAEGDEVAEETGTHPKRSAWVLRELAQERSRRRKRRTDIHRWVHPQRDLHAPQGVPCNLEVGDVRRPVTRLRVLAWQALHQKHLSRPSLLHGDVLWVLGGGGRVSVGGDGGELRDGGDGLREREDAGPGMVDIREPG